MLDQSEDSRKYMETYENFLGALVDYYEREDVLTYESIKIASELSRSVQEIPFEFFRSNLRFRRLDEEKFNLYLVELFPGIEDLFFMLHERRMTNSIGRLKNATEYRGTILIFTNDDWSIACDGIYSENDKRFRSGDEDMLLGLTKKEFSERLNHNKGLMIVGKWRPFRKSWKLADVNQFSLTM